MNLVGDLQAGKSVKKLCAHFGVAEQKGGEKRGRNQDESQLLRMGVKISTNKKKRRKRYFDPDATGGGKKSRWGGLLSQSLGQREERGGKSLWSTGPRNVERLKKLFSRREVWEGVIGGGMLRLSPEEQT